MAEQQNGQTAAPKAERKGIFSVLSHLRHNGKHYSKGSKVELTGKEAKPLLDRKVVAVPTPKAAPAAEGATE